MDNSVAAVVVGNGQEAMVGLHTSEGEIIAADAVAEVVVVGTAAAVLDIVAVMTDLVGSTAAAGTVLEVLSCLVV